MVPLAGSGGAVYAGFTTPWAEVIQVSVGKEPEVFLVHKHVLDKISFFKACLQAKMEEGVSGVVKIPEDCPATFRLLVHYGYTGMLHPNLNLLETARKAAIDPVYKAPAYEKLDALIKLYITAKKFGWEQLQNRVIDEIQTSLKHISFGPLT